MTRGSKEVGEQREVDLISSGSGGNLRLLKIKSRFVLSSLQILYALRQDDVLAADTHPLFVQRIVFGKRRLMSEFR